MRSVVEFVDWIFSDLFAVSTGGWKGKQHISIHWHVINSVLLPWHDTDCFRTCTLFAHNLENVRLWWISKEKYVWNRISLDDLMRPDSSFYCHNSKYFTSFHTQIRITYSTTFIRTHKNINKHISGRENCPQDRLFDDHKLDLRKRPSPAIKNGFIPQIGKPKYHRFFFFLNSIMCGVC